MEEIRKLIFLSLNEKDIRDIEAYYEIAKANGAVVSLDELLRLGPAHANEREFRKALVGDSALGSRFLLESGYLFERSQEADGERIREAISWEEEKRTRAGANLRLAGRFSSNCADENVLLFSVSGGNSYLSARADDDIDFFCVTKTSYMWIFLVRALLLARIFRLRNRGVPQLCFSCVMDERWARNQFRRPKDALFARDALTAKVIWGQSAYHALLKEGSWIAGVFPSFYERRLQETNSRPGPQTALNFGYGILNSLMYRVVGPYIVLKAWLLNRRFGRNGSHSSLFSVKIGADHCVYESNRYRSLRRMYQSNRNHTTTRQGNSDGISSASG